MDDTDALSAADVAPADVPADLMKVERYPETDARQVVLSRVLQPGDAAWEQDSSRVSCPGPGCGKRFQLLNRRHHCRCVCGPVVFVFAFFFVIVCVAVVQEMREGHVRCVCAQAGALGQRRQRSLLCRVLQQLQRPVAVRSTVTGHASLS